MSNTNPDIPTTTSPTPEIPTATTSVTPDVPTATTSPTPEIPTATTSFFPDVPTATTSQTPDIPTTTSVTPDIPTTPGTPDIHTTSVTPDIHTTSVTPDVPSAAPTPDITTSTLLLSDSVSLPEPAVNPGCELDYSRLLNVNINPTAVNRIANNLLTSRVLEGEHKAAWMLKAITFIDLTTLGGDDTSSNVSRMCYKAAKPVAEDLIQELGFPHYSQDEKDRIKNPIRTAAVCVYPAKVACAYKTITDMKYSKIIKLASVAAGFPSGQMHLDTRLMEIGLAIDDGADEIDVVINRSAVILGEWYELYNEIKLMKAMCDSDRNKKVSMKVIISAGELDTLNNVYKASLVAMMAGANFIKTSTGKETINATLQFGIVMAWAILDYNEISKHKVGLKPAGGIRTVQDAITWLVMVKEFLGKEWLQSKYFRIGASGLLTDIECKLYEFITGSPASPHEFSMG